MTCHYPRRPKPTTRFVLVLVLVAFLRVESILAYASLRSGQLTTFSPSAISGSGWRACISGQYQVLGPFPQEAREQHFLSPSYPIGASLSSVLNATAAYPSHLADGGFVLWESRHLDPQSNAPSQTGCRALVRYVIAFPRIRWGSIRATEGWAGLQHHTLLRSTITIRSPSVPFKLENGKPTYLLLFADQCSHIAIMDRDLPRSAPRWHTCNIYAYSDTPGIKIPLSYDRESTATYVTEGDHDALEPLILTPGTSKQFDILVGLDYEIRLFGDPLVLTNSTLPTIEASLHVDIEYSADHIARNTNPLVERLLDGQLLLHSDDTTILPCVSIGEPASHVIPHFVSGWAYGDIIGIELTSCSHESWTVHGAMVSTKSAYNEDSLKSLGLTIAAFEPIVLGPSQTRAISLKIEQLSSLPATLDSFDVTLSLGLKGSRGNGSLYSLNTTIFIVNHDSLARLKSWENGIMLTYSSVSNTPASAVVLPPEIVGSIRTSETRILLALHGAGVMHTHPAWIAALPRPPNTWVLVVQGLSPWGLDWREASRADVCCALRALVLRLTNSWDVNNYCTPHDALESVTLRQSGESNRIPVIVIGHSNGGQGALFLASQFPDTFPALIPAAGYTSARLYVSTQHSRGSGFADASLEAIMRASVQGQDGDIIAGNLVMSRVHLVHGGNDENVPVWHSRERMVLVKAWDPAADVSFTEVLGKPHVWSTIFREEPVASAVADLIASPYSARRKIETSFTFTVVWPSEAGSMNGWRVRELSIPGRMAKVRVDGIHARTMNVYGLSIDISKTGMTSRSVFIDGQTIYLPDLAVVWLRRNSSGDWEVVQPFQPYPSGPLSRVLTSPTTIQIVIPSSHNSHFLSIALRIAHNLYTYLKLDCALVYDGEALERGQLQGSVVVIGGSKNLYGMKTRSSPLEVGLGGSIWISGITYDRPGTGALSFHENHLYMDAKDEAGYERILLAFPLRTGVPSPEWIILGPECDLKGYAGVYAAGFWNRRGGLSETMSYFN